jgi:hypothetical protein
LTEPLDANPAYHGAVNRVPDGCAAGDTLTVSGTAYSVRETIMVPCLTWKRFAEDNQITFVDLFVLDTEGHEIEVIDGMRGSAVLPALMCVEDGWREDIRRKLRDLEYVFDIEHFGNHVYIRKDLLSLFVLRGLHRNY